MDKSKYPSNWLNNPLFEYRKHKTTGKIQRRKKYRRDPFGGRPPVEGTRAVLNLQRDLQTGPDPSKIVSSGAIFRAERQARKERRLLEAREAEGLPPGGLEEAARIRAEGRREDIGIRAEGRGEDARIRAEGRGEDIRIRAEERRAAAEKQGLQEAADAFVSGAEKILEPSAFAEASDIRNKIKGLERGIAQHGQIIQPESMARLQAQLAEQKDRLGAIVTAEREAAQQQAGAEGVIAEEEQKAKQAEVLRKEKQTRVFKLQDQILKIDEEINTLKALKGKITATDKEMEPDKEKKIDAQIAAKEKSKKTVQGWLDEAQGGGETGGHTPEDLDRFVAQAKLELGVGASREEIRARVQELMGAQ